MSARNLEPRLLRVCLRAVGMAVRPRWEGGIGAWADAQRVPITSTQNSSYAGTRYEFDRFPVAASLVFGFFQHPTARECFIQKPVQTALTTCAFFASAYQLCEGDPGNILYIMHTRDEARKKMKDNLKPIFSRIPALKGGKSGEVAGENEDSTAEALRFTRGILYIGGGQSVSTLTGVHVQTVLLDEAERYGKMGETSVFELARGRMTGADRGKMVAFSKPEREASFQRDEKTGMWNYRPELLSMMDAEWVSGDQREFHCPCPHCGGWSSIQWEQIRYQHLNEALPGADPVWNWDRFPEEIYWECPKCAGKVHEGPEKHAMILAGARAAKEGRFDEVWRPCPLEERRQKGMFPRGQSHKWSARLSALTDIAFLSLRWDRLAQRWINAQGDPTKIVNFVNEVLGKPQRREAVTNTTVEHLRKLIPGPRSTDPPPWRMRDERGNLTGLIPILSPAFHYVGMVVDRQQEYLKYAVRAFAKDGRSFLLDYGLLNSFDDVVDYMDSHIFTTLDHVEAVIWKCYIDVNGPDVPAAYDFCFFQNPRVEGIRGIGDEDGRIPEQAHGSYCWVGTRPNCPERPVQYHKIASQYWERHLYVNRIQHFDPRRHRPWAPGIYFPTDIGDDYLQELVAMQLVAVPVKKGSAFVNWVWKKINSDLKNDYGDIEKYFCVMDYNLGGREVQAGLQKAEAAEHNGTALDPGEEEEAPAPAVREYLLR